MGLEKDVMHVVIKLPFKRPSDFVEPPPVVWTDDMEQQLWKHMNQKHTDWNYIAEQFGVPTSYLVRHAAFMYETQLRGIQQQLRLSEAGKPTAISSSPPPAVMTSTSSSNTQRSSRPSSQRQVQPISSSSSSSRTQQLLRSSTVWKDALEQQNDEYTPTSPPPATTQSVTNTNEPMAGSASSTSLRNSPNSKQTYDQPSTTTHRSITSSSMDIEATAMATAPINRYQQSIHDDSMILSTISNISPRNKSINSGNNLNDTDLTPLSDHEEHSNYASPQQNALYRSSDAHITSQPSDRSIRKDVNHGSNELTSRYYGKEHNEGGLNDMDDNDHDTNDVDHTEEPAFLPSRKMEGSQLLNSLRASSHQSRSALSSPAFSSSKSTSPLSTSQRYSPHTILAASILREPSASPSLPSSSSPLQQETANLSNNTSEQDATQVSMETERQNISEESSNENKSTNSNNDDASDTSSNDKAKMVFGPNLSRVPTTQPSDESNKDANSALNSVGSSFSDLSDYSVTQSAMEDAFMSKLNNGSKMSSLAFSRKDT
ncbi:hypothetical protein BCR42DRAFT_390804 [Absidia repens]|uniref:Autophagy-related protein 29 n=1 Tax=Absidia repens TaxID=90262 RepID=A0A1X2ILN3_9FUNG|nr:hypothetical protein BCR42DRAFT_390804 [Absidia repens]